MTPLRPLLLLLPLLAACAPLRAAYHRASVAAWQKHGACAVVCDRRQGFVSVAYTVNPWTCLCSTPTVGVLNAQHDIPPGQEHRNVRCCGGCKEEAERILAQQPWRRQHPEPFEDPLGDLLRDVRDGKL